MAAEFRDHVITELADAEAELREQNTLLLDILADVAFENGVLRRLYEREHVERIHGDAEIRRQQWARSRRRQGPRGAAA
jgi:hypothetical protein